MKKFRFVTALIIIFYFSIAILGNQLIYRKKKAYDRDTLYLIEVNRLYNTYIKDSEAFRNIEENGQISFSAEEYQYIRQAAYLPANTDSAADNKESSESINEIREFYKHRNGYYSIVEPVLYQQEIIGYLRFDCVIPEMGNEFYVLFNLGFFLACLLQFGILLYIYRKIIRPFHVFSEIPYELSKGNLKHDIKEEKSRYFGRFIWGIGMLKDALANQRQRELELARDKKMILLAISHDIKTPLNTINLYAKALERGMYQTKEEQKKAAVKIQEKSAEIDGFVKDIVKSSTEDFISIEVNNREYYLKELIGKIQNGYMEKCKLRHMRLTIGDSDNYLLYGDLDRVYEAVGNLMENAFKYGDGIEIHIEFTEEENYLLLTIYNSGQPVEESEMVHLFDSFFRGANADGKQGNGLGLYICREIMLKMKGDIYASRYDRGMSVTLVIKISS